MGFRGRGGMHGIRMPRGGGRFMYGRIVKGRNYQRSRPFEVSELFLFSGYFYLKNVVNQNHAPFYRSSDFSSKSFRNLPNIRNLRLHRKTLFAFLVFKMYLLLSTMYVLFDLFFIFTFCAVISAWLFIC